jgi:asparagine synthase (glutamine-hydrolysing)
MTGNYGDEILRRISVWGIHEAPTWLYSTEFQAHVTDAGARFQQFRRENQLSFVLFRQLPWHHHGLSCLEESQLATRTPFLDCELHKLAYRTPTAALAGNQTRERLISDGAPALARLRTDLGFGGPAGSPMAGLYQRLQLTTMKAEYAYDYGMPSWAASADSVLSKFGLPHLFLGRHKFYHYRIWYRDQLANHVREVLLDPQALARPYLRRNGVEQVVEGHLRGKANYTVHIHKLLTLELIQRQLVSVQ